MKWKIKTVQATLEKLFVFSALLFTLAICKSQVYDDFGDGDICSGVPWGGDVGSFGVTGEGMLTLSGNESGRAYLSTAHLVGTDECEWHIRIKLNFAPSANNFARFYLIADRADLTDTELSGFYLQFGENQSNDAVELFYKSGGTVVSVCRGTNGLISNSFDYNIKVIKDDENRWQVYVDNLLSGEYKLDLDCDNNDYELAGGYMGIYCQFTSSNIGKFFFDDIYCGAPRIDTTAPKMSSISLTTSLNRIIVNYSEKTTAATALLTDKYVVVEDNVSPIGCQFVQNCYDKVILTFAEEFADRRTYHLKCSGISDCSGNISSSDTAEFRFQKPKRNDVVISEIMADPYPTVGLPPAEYLELKNRTEHPIALCGWKIQIGTSVRELSAAIIDSGGYALIVGSGSQSLFAQYSPLALVSSLTITDAGQNITLWSDFGEVIHNVEFKKEWHTQEYKKDGGWALEMADIENPCGGRENWFSSEAVEGGTPCKCNSVTKENSDVEPPEIRKIAVENPCTILLYFTETVHFPDDKIPVEIDNATISYVEAVSHSNASWKIVVAAPFETGRTYTLSVKDSICDCVDQTVEFGSRVKFCLPEKPVYGDVVINEILSDPPENSDADFIEIYNRSSKTISLKDLRIGSGGDEYPAKSCSVDYEGGLLFPKSYIAICKNATLTKAQYYCPYPENILQCDSLPAFSNGKGIVHLTDCEYNKIDKVIYGEDMHYAMLKSTDGVSLERIHTDALNGENNWKSAAASVGFATPGYKNSQWSEDVSNVDKLQVIPEIFSPDNDGFDDYAEIYCKFDDTENRVSVIVFDRNGNAVKTLANNELCGTEVKYIWDGITEKGTMARPDIYIVKMQFWNLSGKAKSYKKHIGIAIKKGAVY